VRVTRCFSFDPVLDKSLLEYIDSLPNASGKIRELIRLELGLNTGDPLVDKIVQGVISKLGSGVVLAATTKEPPDMDDGYKESIISIMSMK
jgi:hypothetical protein